MRSTFAMAALFVGLSSVVAFAAPPVKFVDGPKGAKIMVDAKGMALYTYDRDEKDVSKCTAACLANWPIFVATAEDKPDGDWKIVDSTDGKKMWSYKGAPLYYWVKDVKAGDAGGESVATWHLINP